MAKKGDKKSEKRLAASKLIPLSRKRYAWNVKAKPGPHQKKSSVALGFVVRDMLGIAKTMREAKAVLNKSSILVDGKPVKQYKHPIGLFDLITVVPEKKTSRVVLSSRGKFALAEEKFGEKQKVCKVVSKKKIAKGLTQLATNDGRTFREKSPSVNVGGSLLIEVPSQKILKELQQKANNIALVVGGKHVGEVGKIKDILPGTMSRPKLLTLKTKDAEFLTVGDRVVIVGEEKPLVNVK